MGPRAMVTMVVAACAGTTPAPRVVVLPEAWATTRPATAAPAAPRVRRALQLQQLAPVADDASSLALAGEDAGCLDDLGCLRRVGERLRAHKVVTLKLAELGETLAVQLTLVDVGRASREATLREVVRPNEAARVAAALDELGGRIAHQAGAPAGDRSRDWLWLGSAGLAVGVAIAWLAVGSLGDNEPDAVIVPP